MLTRYITAAMHRATYEILEDGTFYGSIPDCAGVLANSESLEECRDELQEALEGWIALGLKLGHNLPVIEGIDINIRQEVA